MLHHEEEIPAIEERPDSLADCPVQPSDPITFSDLDSTGKSYPSHSQGSDQRRIRNIQAWQSIA